MRSRSTRARAADATPVQRTPRPTTCSWHRDRGAIVCGNAMKIQIADLEARVLGMFETQALAPSVVAYVIERTLELVRERRNGKGLGAKRARAAEVTRE